MESFFMKVLHWIWRLLHGTTVSWNKLFQLIMWSLMHFNSIKAQLEILNFDQWLWYMCRWHARQNEGVTGTLEDHDLQTSTGESYICNQAQHKKGPFRWLEIYKRGSAQQWLKKGSVIWQLQTATKREETNLILPPPPTSTEVDTGPHTLKKSVWTLGFTHGQSPHTDDDFCCGKHLFSRWQWTNQYPNHGDLPLYVRQGFSVRVLVIHCLAFLDYDNVINNQK